MLNRFSANTTLEATIWGKNLDAVGPDTAVVSLHGGLHVITEAFASYLGSGYQAKFIEYPTFDLRLLKRCLQRNASSVFGSIDPFSLTEFIVNRLKRAETRDWMASRPALRNAIIKNDLSLPELVSVVANIVGVWPLFVSCLKETGRKDERDSFVVRSSLVGISPASWKCFHHFCFFLEEGNGRVPLHCQYDPCWYVVAPDYVRRFIGAHSYHSTLVPCSVFCKSPINMA